MSNNNKSKLRNNNSEIRNKKKANIPNSLKDEFLANSVRINDMDYIESFFKNNNSQLLKEIQKIKKKDKNAVKDIIEKKKNPFGKKNIEQIDEVKYQKLSNKNIYDDDDYEVHYPKKRYVTAIEDDVYNRLLKGKYCMSETEIIENISNNDVKQINDNSYKNLLKNSNTQKNIKNMYINTDINQNDNYLRNQSPNGKIIIKRMLSPIKNDNKSNSLEKKKIKVELHRRQGIKGTYYIREGNNGELVERVILTRKNWSVINKNLVIYANLIWTPLNYDIDFGNRPHFHQFINHFEFNSEVYNKMKMFYNLLNYCENYKIDLFSFIPVTIIFHLENEDFENQLESFKKFYLDLPSLIDKKENTYSSYFTSYYSKKLGDYQKIYIPKTFYTGKNVWILKPINSNCGKDIKVFSSLNDIITEIKSIKENKQFYKILIQKYLESPLLYSDRKFDMRIWILFTFLRGKMECYMFKEGHLKASSLKFTLNSNDIYIHLTNYSVQKYNPEFSKIAEGNEIPYDDLQKQMNKNKVNIDFKKTILPKIVNIISIVASTIKTKINLRSRDDSFEIYGCDFILDSNYQPFLIEVNNNPGYEESSKLIKMLVPRMIDDAFRLTIDKVFIRKDREDIYINKSPFPVTGYSDEENMWQKIKFK